MSMVHLYQFSLVCSNVGNLTELRCSPRLSNSAGFVVYHGQYFLDIVISCRTNAFPKLNWVVQMTHLFIKVSRLRVAHHIRLRSAQTVGTTSPTNEGAVCPPLPSRDDMGKKLDDKESPSLKHRR